MRKARIKTKPAFRPAGTISAMKTGGTRSIRVKEGFTLIELLVGIYKSWG
jgi:hypothetical protein